MLPLSVIICTHNPRTDYFGRTLAALRGQSLPQERWELVVIDNFSEPPVTRRFDFGLASQARVVREEKLGLTPARLCGICEATGDLFVFVDDDNVLDPDYLETALHIAQERPYLCSWSGQCRPGFEETPAEWTRRYWGNLVIREFDHDKWSNLPRLVETMPCGAGLCVRRDVAQHYLYLNELENGRFSSIVPEHLFCPAAITIWRRVPAIWGMGVGLISAQKLTHLIPPVRLTEDYLARLAEGISFHLSCWITSAAFKTSPGECRDA